MPSSENAINSELNRIEEIRQVAAKRGWHLSTDEILRIRLIMKLDSVESNLLEALPGAGRGI